MMRASLAGLPGLALGLPSGRPSLLVAIWRMCRGHGDSSTSLPGLAASAAWNHGCAELVWLGTRSMVILMPRSCAASMSRSSASIPPNSGSTSRGSATS